MRLFRKLLIIIFLSLFIFTKPAVSKPPDHSLHPTAAKKELNSSELAEMASRLKDALTQYKLQQRNTSTKPAVSKKRINRPELAKLPSSSSSPTPSAASAASRQRSRLNSLKGRLPDLKVRFNKKNGTAVFIKAQGLFCREDAARMRAGSSTSSDMAVSCLQSYRDLLKVQNASEEFSQKKEIVDSRGLKHIKFQQVYKGIPLVNKEAIVHLDKNSAVYLVEGRIEPTPDLDVKPKVSHEEAVKKVMRDLSKSGNSLSGDSLSGTPSSGDSPSSELVIHTDGLGMARLAYRITAYRGIERWRYFVDARIGQILEKYNDTHYEAVPGSGDDLFGQRQSFSVWKQGSTYSLIDTSLDMVNKQYPSASNSLGNGNIAIFDADHQDPDRISSISPVTATSPDGGWDPAGVSLLHHLILINNYYKAKFDRDSIDGYGFNNIGIIHVGENWDNACWTG
ncbi:MAG: hypothetical protein AB1847_07635, partial [bacterium]